MNTAEKRSDGRKIGVRAVSRPDARPMPTDNERDRERLQSQARASQAVATLGQIALTSDFQNLMDRTVVLLVQTLGCPYASVFELESGGKTLLVRASVGWRKAAASQSRVNAGPHTQAGFTLLAGEPIVVADRRSEKRFAWPPPNPERGLVSGVSVVISGNPQPYGVLAVYTRLQRDFKADEVHFLRAVSNILAAAVRQRQAEQALRDSEERIRAVLTTLVDSVITINERGIIDTVNPAAERLFGYAAAELLGCNVNLLMPSPFAGEHDSYLSSYLRTGQAKIIGIGREVIGRRKNGTIFPMDLAVSELRLDGRRMFTGVVRDISDRRNLERELLQAAAEEQRRIGQDLHDGLCQQLAGVAFATEVLAKKLTARSSPEAAGMFKIGELVDEAITQARGLARGLQPVAVEAGGLVAALQSLATNVQEMFHVSCRFATAGLCLIHDNAIATHLFRIAQEAVSNAIKHGKAAKILIDLTVTGDHLRLAIRDNGAGVNIIAGMSGAKERIGNAGMGLNTMAYRARMIGGSLVVRPGERYGTIVTCDIRGTNFMEGSTGKATYGQEKRKSRPRNGKTKNSGSHRR